MSIHSGSSPLQDPNHFQPIHRESEEKEIDPSEQMQHETIEQVRERSLSNRSSVSSDAISPRNFSITSQEADSEPEPRFTINKDGTLKRHFSDLNFRTSSASSTSSNKSRSSTSSEDSDLESVPKFGKSAAILIDAKEENSSPSNPSPVEIPYDLLAQDKITKEEELTNKVLIYSIIENLTEYVKAGGSIPLHISDDELQSRIESLERFIIEEGSYPEQENSLKGLKSEYNHRLQTEEIRSLKGQIEFKTKYSKFIPRYFGDKTIPFLKLKLAKLIKENQEHVRHKEALLNKAKGQFLALATNYKIELGKELHEQKIPLKVIEDLKDCLIDLLSPDRTVDTSLLMKSFTEAQACPTPIKRTYLAVDQTSEQAKSNKKLDVKHRKIEQLLARPSALKVANSMPITTSFLEIVRNAFLNLIASALISLEKLLGARIPLFMHVKHNGKVLRYWKNDIKNAVFQHHLAVTPLARTKEDGSINIDFDKNPTKNLENETRMSIRKLTLLMQMLKKSTKEMALRNLTIDKVSRKIASEKVQHPENKLSFEELRILAKKEISELVPKDISNKQIQMLENRNSIKNVNWLSKQGFKEAWNEIACSFPNSPVNNEWRNEYEKLLKERLEAYDDPAVNSTEYNEILNFIETHPEYNDAPKNKIKLGPGSILETAEGIKQFASTRVNTFARISALANGVEIVGERVKGENGLFGLISGQHIPVGQNEENRPGTKEAIALLNRNERRNEIREKIRTQQKLKKDNEANAELKVIMEAGGSLPSPNSAELGFNLSFLNEAEKEKLRSLGRNRPTDGGLEFANFLAQFSIQEQYAIRSIAIKHAFARRNDFTDPTPQLIYQTPAFRSRLNDYIAFFRANTNRTMRREFREIFTSDAQSLLDEALKIAAGDQKNADEITPTRNKIVINNVSYHELSLTEFNDKIGGPAGDFTRKFQHFLNKVHSLNIKNLNNEELQKLVEDISSITKYADDCLNFLKEKLKTEKNLSTFISLEKQITKLSDQVRMLKNITSYDFNSIYSKYSDANFAKHYFAVRNQSSSPLKAHLTLWKHDVNGTYQASAKEPDKKAFLQSNSYWEPVSKKDQEERMNEILATQAITGFPDLDLTKQLIALPITKSNSGYKTELRNVIESREFTAETLEHFKENKPLWRMQEGARWIYKCSEEQPKSKLVPNPWQEVPFSIIVQKIFAMIDRYVTKEKIDAKDPLALEIWQLATLKTKLFSFEKAMKFIETQDNRNWLAFTIDDANQKLKDSLQIYFQLKNLEFSNLNNPNFIAKLDKLRTGIDSLNKQVPTLQSLSIDTSKKLNVLSEEEQHFEKEYQELFTKIKRNVMDFVIDPEHEMSELDLSTKKRLLNLESLIEPLKAHYQEILTHEDLPFDVAESARESLKALATPRFAEFLKAQHYSPQTLLNFIVQLAYDEWPDVSKAAKFQQGLKDIIKDDLKMFKTELTKKERMAFLDNLNTAIQTLEEIINPIVISHPAVHEQIHIDNKHSAAVQQSTAGAAVQQSTAGAEVAKLPENLERLLTEITQEIEGIEIGEKNSSFIEFISRQISQLVDDLTNIASNEHLSIDQKAVLRGKIATTVALFESRLANISSGEISYSRKVLVSLQSLLKRFSELS